MVESAERRELAWAALPTSARVYVAAVMVVGAALAVSFFPTRIDRPVFFAALLVLAYVTSTWKVNLPLALSSGSTLSVSYAADVMALLLLGPRQAMVVAMFGAWAQCSRQPRRVYPTYRTVFSVAVLAITMRVVAWAYLALSGPPQAVSLVDLTRPLVAVITTYFVINTTLVALAIALSTGERMWPVWRDNFLWSAPSFIVAGGAGAVAAIVVIRGDYWLAPLMAAPVYLTYRTYRVFLGRIEDEQRHQRALAAEKERLAVTLRSVGDGVIATDTAGAVRLLNRAAEILTGWTQAEAAGRPLGEVLRATDPDTGERLNDTIAAMLAPENPLGTSRSATLVSRDGRELPIQEVYAPLRDADNRVIGAVVAFRDASDALRIQQERTKASKLESLGLLAGGIAHDFNNILTAVLGNISLAQAHRNLHPDVVDALVAAEEACVRARQLTQQLLTFAKGGAPIKKPVRVERIVRESVRMGLSGSTVRWTAQIDPALWTVSADEGQLLQVFNNIIINAQQAMPRGGSITIRADNLTEASDRWEFGLRVKAGPYVRVSIADQGTGIRPGDLGKIFEPYFSTKPMGSGLGLATSLSIVKNHGGFIAIDTEVGRGTTVHVCLPAAPSEPLIEAPRPPREGTAGSGRVLVLDDEPAIRTLAVQLLRVLGYEAEAVGTGSAAIACYRAARDQRRPFDLVLLDLTIPGELGGSDTLRALRAIDPDVKAIVVSGYASDPVLANYRDYGFRAVVTKPFTLQELSAALDEVGKARTGPTHESAPTQAGSMPASKL